MATKNPGFSAPLQSALSQGSAADTPELQISIYPRGRTTWRCTSAQLREEGLIPSDFEWLVANQLVKWAENGLRYALQRCGPPGVKGARKLWKAVDYWNLDVGLEATRGDGFSTARLYEKRRELQLEEWRQSPPGLAQNQKHFDALMDDRFQAFLKAHIEPLVRPAGRRAGGR